MSVTRIPIAINRAYQHHGIKSYIYALNKYSFKPDTPGPYQYNVDVGAVSRVLADGTSGAVGATDQQNDSLYTCPVQIGTPAQTVNLDFDSGSSDLWVWSEYLPKATITAGTKSGHEVFHSNKSSSFKNLSGSTWQISYGDGSSASGSVGTDTIKIGDITVTGQAIELASKLSSEFTQSAGSGLLGLAFGSINTVKPNPVKTPVENMIAESAIPQSAELFTVYLGSTKVTDDLEQGQSFYTFGAIDQAVVQASGQEIAYTPVDNSQGFWMFDSESMTINGKTVELSGNKAIADTGTTLALVSNNVVTQIYGAISGAKYDDQQQGWLIPTGNTSSLPEITFAVGNKQFAIEKEQLTFQDLGNGFAYGAIQSRGDLTFDILGDAFLVNVYAVFDVGNVQFGCVQRPSPGAASTGGSGDQEL